MDSLCSSYQRNLVTGCTDAIEFCRVLRQTMHHVMERCSRRTCPRNVYDLDFDFDLDFFLVRAFFFAAAFFFAGFLTFGGGGSTGLPPARTMLRLSNVLLTRSGDATPL